MFKYEDDNPNSIGGGGNLHHGSIKAISCARPLMRDHVIKYPCTPCSAVLKLFSCKFLARSIMQAENLQKISDCSILQPGYKAVCILCTEYIGLERERRRERE